MAVNLLFIWPILNLFCCLNLNLLSGSEGERKISTLSQRGVFGCFHVPAQPLSLKVKLVCTVQDAKWHGHFASRLDFDLLACNRYRVSSSRTYSIISLYIQFACLFLKMIDVCEISSIIHVFPIFFTKGGGRVAVTDEMLIPIDDQL